MCRVAVCAFGLTTPPPSVVVVSVGCATLTTTGNTHSGLLVMQSGMLVATSRAAPGAAGACELYKSATIGKNECPAPAAASRWWRWASAAAPSCLLTCY